MSTECHGTRKSRSDFRLKLTRRRWEMERQWIELRNIYVFNYNGKIRINHRNNNVIFIPASETKIWLVNYLRHHVSSEKHELNYDVVLGFLARPRSTIGFKRTRRNFGSWSWIRIYDVTFGWPIQCQHEQFTCYNGQKKQQVSTKASILTLGELMSLQAAVHTCGVNKVI